MATPQDDGKNEPPGPGLPNSGISEILGLVELLKNKGGREDIYKLAAELKMEFGETLAVIRGAELLGLVHTPGGDVVIEPLGEKITRSRINGRKQIIRERLLKIPLFIQTSEFLKGRDGMQASREELMEKLAEWAPNENAEQTFKTLVYWGRYAEFFGYNDDTSSFYLDSESTSGGGTSGASGSSGGGTTSGS